MYVSTVLKGKFSSGIEGTLASTLNHNFNWKQLLYELKFLRWFYFREFRESNPRENFHFNLCLFIVMTTFNSKIAKLTPRELPHLAKTLKITVREF